MGLGIVTFTYSYLSDKVSLMIIGFVIVFFTATFGFGLICNLFAIDTKSTLVKSFSYARTKSAVIIEINSPVHLTKDFTDARTYNSICDSSKVYFIQEINSYNQVISSKIEIQ